ncbi:MAG: UvrD-helicase domain-containing protein [Candidatus Omnitrophota bacterium]
MPSSKRTFTFPEVRVVEASAGSGKTFALAKRYVQLVLDPMASRELPIRGILAITFMKKASFEMKQRILLFLKRIALRTMSSAEARDILGPIGLDENSASIRAFDVMEEIIHHYNFFQVQTIDSFINALLSGCAFKIGLSTRFQIRHNPIDCLSYSLDKLIEKASHDPKIERIFTDFLDQYLLLENKSSWFPKRDILALLNSLYHQRNSYGMEFREYPAGTDIIAQMTDIVTLMQTLREKLPQKTSVTFQKSLDKFLGRYTTAFDFDKLSDYFQREEFPVNGGSDVPGPVADLWDEIRLRITRLAESEARQLFNPYVRLFHEMVKEFQIKTMRDDILFMEELNRKARALFDEGGVTVEELYYRLAARFRHYLIDEFQDTSRLQWGNLMMMIEEALSTGGSLFYVGDKKQAIYGFRGGEAALFDELKERFSHFNVTVEQLRKNYRSHEAIVKFNNMIFDLNNLRRFIELREDAQDIKKSSSRNGFWFDHPEYERLARVFEHCAQEFNEHHPGGYVKLERVPGVKRQERDEVIRQKVLSLVNELHERYSWREIAILVRKNSEVEQVTAWLMEQGIPVKSERTLNITENSIVLELVSLLTFLNSPIDDLAFARMILGDVFCKASGLNPGEMHAFLFKLRANKERHRSNALYREFQQAYPEEWERLIMPFFKSTGFYPLYELFISILKEWRVLEHFEDQCGFIMKLVEIIKEHEEEGCDLSSFLEYFERLTNEDTFVNVPALDSVEVITTHKAKGLEFPVVILPFAAIEIKIGNRGGGKDEEPGQRSFVLNTDADEMELLRIKTEYLPHSDYLYGIYRMEAVDAIFNELNNVYVSLTRAEKEMYVFVPERTGNSFNLLNFLVPDNLTESGHVSSERKAREPWKGGDLQELPVSQYRDWIRHLEDEFSTEQETPASRGKIRRGKELHGSLSLIGNLNREDELPEVKGTDPELRKIIDKNELKFLFYTDGQVFTEKEVVDRYGHTKRIDRLIVRKDEAVVVDYKSTRLGGNLHQRQVRDYMDAVSGIYPDKKVHGFVLYLDSLELEEII